jgi:hypothetical protein
MHVACIAVRLSHHDVIFYACVYTINSDPSELAVLKGFDFAIDNSGDAMDIIKDGLLREPVKPLSLIALH